MFLNQQDGRGYYDYKRPYFIYWWPQFTWCKCKATDLRAGAALVIAGLMAEGKTEITNIEFILRGYSEYY